MIGYFKIFLFFFFFQMNVYAKISLSEIIFSDSNQFDTSFTIHSIELLSLKNDRLDDLLRSYNKKVISKFVLNKILYDIRNYLLDEGYLFSSIYFFLDSIDKRNHQIFLQVDFNNLEGFKFGDIKTHGTKTNNKVLNKMSLIQIGETFSFKKIKLMTQRFRNIGYFNFVSEPILYRDSIKNLIYPWYHLRDHKLNEINIAFLYNRENSLSTYNQWQGIIDISLFNIKGTAKDLKLFLLSSHTDRDFIFNYKHPWLDQFLEFNLYANLYQKADILSKGNVRLDILKTYFNYRLGISFGTFFINQIERDTNYNLKELNSGFILSMENKDSKFFTKRGYFLNSHINASQKNFYGKNNSYALQYDFSLGYFYPIFITKSVLYQKLKLKGELSQKEFHFYRLGLGGQKSVRGYRSNHFLTNQYLYSNIEYRIRLKNNYTFIFYDPAIYYSFPLKKNQFINSYGIGFITQRNNWLFYFTYALNSFHSFDKGLLHISIKNKF